MKNTLLIISVFMMVVTALSFEKVKTIDLNSSNFTNKDQLRINFRYNNSKISTNHAIEIDDLIDLCESCFAVITYQNGNTKILSSYDLSKLNNHNPLLLIADKKVSSLGDTLVIGEDELLKLEDNQLLETELNSVLDVTYQLNTQNLNKAMISKYFKPASIIFPFDLKTDRWISDIKSITIYKN
ncbi:MAG: hypothetical protein ACE364_02325 [Chlorobiota bacterium]